jgi:cobalt-zinc-cadmium efflux system outer membrane protein
MQFRFRPGRPATALVLSLTASSIAAAQTTPAPPAPSPAQQVSVLTMDQAVRLAIDRNQTLRAQRLTIDESKADEITANFRPQVSFSAEADGIPVFSPKSLTFSTFGNDITYNAGLGYTFERGGKRANRTAVAKQNTDVTAKTVQDAERNTRFQAEQAYINVLLAKSTLDLAQQNLKDISDVVDTNRQRVTAGDLSEADFLKISLQKLDFETDVSQANIGLVQAKAALRLLVGYETLPDTFDVTGDLAHVKHTVDLDQLKQDALDNRADLLAAASSVTLAQKQAQLEISNRARDVDGLLNYERTGSSNAMDVGASWNLPFGDRNQGNIAHAQIAVQAANETLSATRYTVLTDVVTAYAQYQTDEQVLSLFESGYLDQAQQSLDITTYAFGRGASSLLDLLDAERTYRDTQSAYRQALADYMTSVQQLNFVVGKQVVQ